MIITIIIILVIIILFILFIYNKSTSKTTITNKRVNITAPVNTSKITYSTPTTTATNQVIYQRMIKGGVLYRDYDATIFEDGTYTIRDTEPDEVEISGRIDSPIVAAVFGRVKNIPYTRLQELKKLQDKKIQNELHTYTVIRGVIIDDDKLTHAEHNLNDMIIRFLNNVKEMDF